MSATGSLGISRKNGKQEALDRREGPVYSWGATLVHSRHRRVNVHSGREFEVVMLTPIHQLGVSGTLGRGVLLAGDIYVSNDQGLIRGFLSDDVRRALGRVQVEGLEDAELWAHYKGRVSSKDVTSGVLGERTLAFHVVIDCLLTELWLEVDNSGDSEEAFAIVANRGRVHAVYQNRLGMRYSTASGEHSAKVVTPQQLRSARDRSDAITGGKFEEVVVEQGMSTRLLRGRARLWRCRYMLQAARTAPDIAVRIAFYVMCLEILFSTDAQELGHKVSERVAHFLGGTGEERMCIYREMKRGYDARSKTVHGEGLKSEDGVIAISESLDRILREVLRKVAGSEHLQDLFSKKGQDELNGYFEKIVFSAERASS
jgi:hypothetical protein